MAKTKCLALSIHNMIRSYGRTVGVNGRITENDLDKLGFLPTLPNGEVLYTPEARLAMVQAYNRGLTSKDFSEFLSIVAHKEEDKDKRSEDDFRDTYRKITGTKKKIDNYNEKAFALQSMVNTKLFTSGKLPRMIKGGDSVAQRDFWTLMTEANYTEHLRQEGQPYIEALIKAQRSLIVGSSGLSPQDIEHNKEIKIHEKVKNTLEKVGIKITPQDLQGSDDVCLESAITGSIVNSAYLEKIDNIDHVSYNLKNKILGHFSNGALQATAMAGKQTYSVMVASMVEGILGILPEGSRGFDTQSLTAKDIKILEDILSIDKKDNLSTITKRVEKYGNYLYDITHPSENPELQVQSQEVADAASQRLAAWMRDNGLTEGDIAVKLNAYCKQQGAYAEKSDLKFLKSAFIASAQFNSEQSWVRELVDEEGRYFATTDELDRTRIEGAYLPVSIVTENGLYSTNVKMSPRLFDQIETRRYDELIGFAVSQISEKDPSANLRYVGSDNLVLGMNPISAQVLYSYNEREKNRTNELGIGATGENGDTIGSRRNKSESKPCLYRNLIQYQQYKQEAQKSILKYLVIPTQQSRRSTPTQQQQQQTHQTPPSLGGSLPGPAPAPGSTPVTPAPGPNPQPSPRPAPATPVTPAPEPNPLSTSEPTSPAPGLAPETPAAQPPVPPTPRPVSPATPITGSTPVTLAPGPEPDSDQEDSYVEPKPSIFSRIFGRFGNDKAQTSDEQVDEEEYDGVPTLLPPNPVDEMSKDEFYEEIDRDQSVIDKYKTLTPEEIVSEMLKEQQSGQDNKLDAQNQPPIQQDDGIEQ